MIHRLLFAGWLAATLAHAQTPPLPMATPESQGFSSERLQRIDAFFADEIGHGRVPGAVVAIARNGRLVYYKAFGYSDKARGIRAGTDTIFQLASMTKVLTAVGALSLTEQGRLPLQSRLDEYYPGFASMPVGVPTEDGKYRLEPQKRPILIHDLMRHTSGLSYGARAEGSNVVKALQPPSSFGAARIGNTAQFIAALTQVPLAYQPGTVFEYGLSYDVLGAVVEKVTGISLDAHLRAVIFGPLQMSETGFHVAEGQAERVAKPLPTNPITGKPQRIASLEAPALFDCGGGCAYGTVGDYIRFGQMLLNGGSLDGVQVLSPQTVAWMTSNHLGPGIVNQVALIEPHREGYGYGLGVAVRTDPGIAAVPGSVGEYSWNGANGTGFCADPKEHLVVVFGTAAPGEIRKVYREQMQDLVYGAMTR